MSDISVATDANDTYVADRLKAVEPFDRVSFARTFEHRNAYVDGTRIHYVIGGQGPIIILGHGWPASWYEWRKVMPLLAERFTCVAFDMPGLGDSQPPSAFDTETVGSLILNFIDQEITTDPFFLVAHDVSGPPLIHMAAYNASRVKKLFLTETSIDGPEMGAILGQHIQEIWHFPVNAARLAAPFASGREDQFIPQFFTEWIYNTAAITPEDIAEYLRVNRKPGVIECGAAYYHKQPAYTPNGDVLPERSLSMPVHFVGAELGFGGHLGGDEKAAFKTIERFASDASYEVFEKCSHWISEDRPVSLAQSISDFFAD